MVLTYKILTDRQTDRQTDKIVLFSFAAKINTEFQNQKGVFCP